jgi:hypothetical protein
MNARYHVPLAIVGSQHHHIFFGKAGVEQAFCHGVSRYRGTADRIGGINLDELLKDIV